MKAETYEALAQVNRAFEQVVEGLKRLQENGVVALEWVQDQSIMAGEMCAGINTIILNKLGTREIADREHFGKMRLTVEARFKNPQT